MAVSANRLELLQIADAVAREKSIDRGIVIAAMVSVSCSESCLISAPAAGSDNSPPSRAPDGHKRFP